jgi:hypothetical protein
MADGPYELYLETAPDGSKFEDGDTIGFHSEEMRDDLKRIFENNGADAHIPGEDTDEDEDEDEDEEQTITGGFPR